MSNNFSTIHRVGNGDYSPIKINNAPNTFYDNRIQYDQKEAGKNSCSIHAAMGAYSDLTGYKFSVDERNEMWKKAVELGASPDWGWYTNSAVDLIRNHANTSDLSDVSSFRVSILGSEFKEALEKGYSVVVAYRGNAEYNKDRFEDDDIDNVEFGVATYGHLVRVACPSNKIEDYTDIEVIDNSPSGSWSNIYTIPYKKLRQLVLNRVYYELAYFYTMKVSEDDAMAAKKKGLEVSLKIAINQSSNKIRKIERELSELEGREERTLDINLK